MGGSNRGKSLRPRELASKANLDVLLVVDGSKTVGPPDFGKEKQLCNALSARISATSQLAVIQFGTQAKIECPLTTNRDEVDKKVEGMVQLGGNANLVAALAHCTAEIGLSRFPNNSKQIWIITDGRFEDPANTALAAQQLKREKQATIFAIGVGNSVTLPVLNKVASPGCSFLTADFDGAMKLLQGNIRGHAKEFSVQLEAEILYPGEIPLRLGEEAVISLKIENVGRKAIPVHSRIVSTYCRLRISVTLKIFKENVYFKEKIAIIPQEILLGDDLSKSITPKLVPKIKGNKANLDAQILALPEVIEILAFDADNNEINSDCSGFFLNHEDFCGDIFSYKPLYEVPVANIITFGPPGSGKSSFVNSVCSSLAIMNLNIAGATREVVTSTLLEFPLHLMEQFEHLRFTLYDVPGVDGKNYKGDEMALMMYGLLPLDVDFKHLTCTFSTIKGRRNTAQEEYERRAHVVAFFVPQGAASDSELMGRLADHYYKITVEHKRKAIVIISHADEISGDEEREEVLNDVCRKLSIDNSSIPFSTLVKVPLTEFHVDKGVLRILLAMISRADDFLTFDRLNPTVCPFAENPFGKYDPSSKGKGKADAASPKSSPSKSQTTTATTSSPKPSPAKPSTPTSARNQVTKGVAQMSIGQQKKHWQFLEKLQQHGPDLRNKVEQVLKEEEIDDDETLMGMKPESWKTLGFKMGEIVKIQGALA